ncbi:MAG: VWA domain-containing protein [Sideroxydans sp.]|nr:VWA domain-containing protein [Sideroxydans sp.]
MRATFTRLASGLQSHLSRPRKGTVTTLHAARHRTRLLDVQRRIRIYLRALWNDDFTIRQIDFFTADEGRKPFIDKRRIYLPSALYADNTEHLTGLEIYRAAAAHASAHLMYSKNHFLPKSLNHCQIAMISAIEDARVEALAIRKFPGLKQLWATQHTATPAHDKTASDYLDRLARALLDETYQDDDPWVSQGRVLFNSADNLEDSHISRTIGLKLADAFQARRIKFNIDTDMQSAPYRDNNRFLWNRPGEALEIINPYLRSKNVLRTDKPIAEPKKRRVPAREVERDKTSHDTYLYPEWNYRSQSADQSWVTLREMDAASGDLQVVESIVAQNKHLVSRMKNLLHAIRDGAVHRIRKLEEGDDIDINAAIRAQIDLRLGRQPDTRIMMRTVRKTRDISVLVLLDLSRSMNNPVQGQAHTALELTQQVSVLFADAIAAVGDPFAIHGFCSESRHNVGYFRLKDFDQPYDDVPKARLAGMTGQLGTRMGAAIRHATYHLNNQKASKKLLLILSDGEPTDVDVPDKHYLRDDAKKSVEEAGHNGIHTYCISLDPSADKYVSRIFGARNYMVVDHVRSLPEKMLLIYAGLTR